MLAGVAAAGIDEPVHEVMLHGRRLAVVLVCSVVGLALVAWLLLRPRPAKPSTLGWFSVSVSVLCLLATVFVWGVVAADDTLTGSPGTVVTTQAAATSYLRDDGLDGMRQIPTGVMIQTSQFTDANNIRLTGYLWQRLPADADTKTANLELPAAVDGGATEQVYLHTNSDNTKTVGWKLRTTLREQFDYSNYPLDRQVIWSTMWPRTPGTVLVPGFAAYPPWEPATALGLYTGMVTGEWRVHFSAFSMGESTTRSTLGLTGATTDATIPALHFSTGVTREYLSPLLDRLVPLIVIALLVFASLFVVTIDSDRRSLAGFSTWTVIGFCGAMMLVVAVQHSSLRSTTGSTDVVYAEYFYFILYLVIALVAFNVVEYTSTRRFRLIDWNGNMAARLLYWPVVTTLLITTTVAVFLL
ncbi:hypothetical protein PUR61_24760 [Streptomyces sp. BE20]|uniref:hypothetical protein n=1 Tax=Streptomyces sp. BE20 TaxID=3002525 RepID=UPI002E798C54|nr:hypothetical protein [Streptomyces sp. BE20]MEE1825368.1 hypothetical protein [Streptomyces sp. BE20]